ncbi:MAG TPA: hypothetical protein VE439_01450 [Anaerolineae bacterium]|nr:hypothetical protein [Anaerolineae bacterium]
MSPNQISQKDIDIAAEESVKIEKERIKDRAYFIKSYIYIEDKTALDGIALFDLWPKQLEVLNVLSGKAREQFIMLLKSRQIGCTWLVLADTLAKMLKHKGYMAIFISKRDIPDCKIMTARVKLMLRKLPKWLIREKKKAPPWWNGLTWEATTHEVIIHRPDGEDSLFLALAASPDTAHSFTSNRVILDEWALHPFAAEIWTGAYPTMNNPEFTGQVIGLSTGRRGTLFEEKWNEAKAGKNMFKPIFLNWRTDPRRDKKWYEQTKKSLPTTYRSQYPANEADAFTVGEGAFFEEWDEDINLAGNITPPADWLRFAAYDPGYSKSCFKWYAVRPDGSLLCYREYAPTRTTDKDQALEIVRRSKYPDGASEDLEYIVYDTSALTPSRDSGISTIERFAEIFDENGLNWSMEPATRDLENGWRRLHEWLQPYEDEGGKLTALLTFTNNCIETRRTYPSCEVSRVNSEDISKDTSHDPQDCDRYAVMSRPEPAEIDEASVPPPGSEAWWDEVWEEYEEERDRWIGGDDLDEPTYLVGREANEYWEKRKRAYERKQW